MTNLQKKTKKYITIFIGGLFLLTTLISVGFSALNDNLNVSGNIEYEYNSKLLYDVLRREANIGTYAQEFTGDHRDSFTEQPTKGVYHWAVPYYDYDDANVILDKWNVIFGGFCWQMFRTTDTGGVKLIYNGIPSNGKCNNTGTDQQIGTSVFNTYYNSLADVGYMYNTRYVPNSKTKTNIDVLSKKYMTDSQKYYYGTKLIYTNGTYVVSGTTKTDTWANTYSSATGLYTCRSSLQSQCSTAYYIVKGKSSYMWGFEMNNGNLLDYYNTDIVFGTSYTESNGTYTLSTTTTITKADWYSNYSTYKNHYTCGDDRTTCSDMEYITSTDDYYYNSLLLSNNYIYAKDFTYNSGTDTYTLSSDRYQSWNMTETDETNLATHHYTCFNQTGECQTLSYVYRTEKAAPTYIYYIDLTEGKSIEDVVNEMLYDDDVNTTNSDIKTYIDDWYQSNMTSYTSYLEDTIFCYNRSQSNLSTNGWNPDGGKVTTVILFSYGSFVCSNDTDKFSISNNKAKLTYPVGLPSYGEINLLSHTYLKKTGKTYWLGSFRNFGASTITGYVISTDGSTNTTSTSSWGIRPVISLKPGTEYSSGDGSKNNPYFVDTTPYS